MINKISKENIKNEFQLKDSFEELSNTSLDNLFETNNYTYKELTFAKKAIAQQNQVEFVTPNLIDVLREDNFTYFSEEMIKYMKELFQVEKVYQLPKYHLYQKMYKEDDVKLSWFDKCASFTHINHFNHDKKFLTNEENESNVSIFFWLFDNEVIIANAQGYESW